MACTAASPSPTVLIEFFLILLLFCPSQGQNVNVFALQPDIWETPRDDVYIRYNMSNQNVASSVTEFTICLRVYFTSLVTIQVLLSYASAEIYDNAIMMYVRDGEHVFRYNNRPQPVIEKVRLPTVLRSWRHYCHVMQGETYTVYVDGEIIASGPIVVDDRVLPLNGTFVVGQEQDGLDKRYNRLQILKGYATQFNIWSYGLDSQKIKDIGTCKINLFGDILSSDRDNIDLINVNVSVKPLRELCNKEENFIIFPESHIFDDAYSFCRLLGSSLYAPMSLSKNDELFATIKKYSTCTGYLSLWLGASDEKEEGIWRRFSDGQLMTQMKFKPGQPDNLTTENCLAMAGGLNEWADYPCADASVGCAPCEERLQSPLYIRGICVGMKSETMVEIIGYAKNGQPYFHGFYGRLIHKTSPQQWSLFNTETNKREAYLNMSSSSLYPIGRHSWTLTESLCDNLIGSKRELSLSACREDQYMCKNGECIDLKARCDAKDDCTDETDEDNCSILRIPEDYRSFKPPKNIVNASLPLQPLLRIEFLRFLSIEDVKESINIEFMIQLSWPDSRIKYMNLRDDTLANQLAGGEIAGIWRPSTNFPNIKDGELKLLGENVYVLKVKKSLPADFNAVNMDEIYGGDAAMIVQQQHYSGSFVCTFNVFYYPFDKQRCSILVQFSSVSKELVAFTTEGSTTAYEQNRELPIYEVSDFFAEIPDNVTRLSMVQVGFKLTRRYTLIVLSIYLPSLMLLAIGYSTLYVQVNLLDVRLGVALTTLLVLYTFFNQTSSSLPQTAYVKLIDIWFFFCTSFLFIIIILHVFVDRFDNNVVTPIVSADGFLKSKAERFASIKKLASSGDQFLKTLRNYVGPVVLSIFFLAYLWAIVG